ncbi:MAG: bacterial Ig-like domain-containing protein [Paludibacteraceae bacterium]
MKKLTLLLSAMLLACATNLWAETYTIAFLTGTNSNSTISNTTAVADVVAASSVDYVAGFTNNCSKAYHQSTSGVKLGSSGNAGTLEFTLADACKANVTKITVQTVKYSTETPTISLYVNGGTTALSSAGPGVDVVHSFETAQEVSTGKVVSTGTGKNTRSYIDTIIIETGAATQTVSVAVAEGQEEWGTVAMSYKADSEVAEWTAATDPVEIAGEGDELFQFVATPADGYKFAGWTTTGDITLTSTTEATTEGSKATETSVVTANFERNATLQSLTISGTATKLDYYVGDTFDPAGLVVTATYSDGATDDVTDQVEWTITPAELALATTSVSVVATWNEVSSAAYEVKDIVVTDPVRFAKWVGEIVEGEYLLVDVSATESIAMNTTITSNRAQYDKITLNAEGQVIAPNATAVWTISRDSAFWTITNGENLLAGTGNNNQVKYETSVTNASRWSITATETGHTIVNYGNNASSKNATLRRNGTYGFACYAATTGTAPVLYKKVTDETFVTVTVTVNDAEMGSVYGGGKYAVGATATLTAIPAAGYKFTGWSNDSEVTTATQALTVTEDITITANFAKGETAIESAAVETSAVKTIENGQLVILRDGVKYNAMGVRLQ